MGKKLYGRRIKVTIESPTDENGNYSKTQRTILTINGGEGSGNEKPGLRVRVKASRSDTKEPNTCELVVSNLSVTNRGRLQFKGLKVTIDAGYQETGLSRIFRGDSRTTDHIRADADWETTIKMGDGERGYANARVAESFAEGAGAGDILNYLANQSGLQIGNIPDVVANLTTTFDQGYVVSGKWRDEMDRLVRSIGYTWSVQDQTIQVLLPGGSRTGFIPKISADSGLVGSPEFGSPEKKGKPALVKFVSLMMPTLPGARVNLKSDRYDGDVRVKKCGYDLDTHGGPWYTNYEGILLSDKPVAR